MKISKKFLYNKYLIIYCFASILFFAPVIIDITILKILSWIIELLLVIYILPYLFIKRINTNIALVIKIMCLILLLSLLTSYFFHNQSLIFTIRVFLNCSFFFVFFFLKQRKVSPDYLEKILFKITITYSVLFIIALLLYPRVLFGFDNESNTINLSRGVARVKVLGTCFLYLCYFMYLNWAIIYRKRKYIFFSIFFFILILLNVSRQHILFAFLIGIWMILKNVNLVKKTLVIGGGFLISLLAYIYVPIIQNLVFLTQDQYNDSGDQNIRILAYRFYLFSYNNNWMEIFFGNGNPHYDSNWGISIENIIEKFGYVLSDVGYAKIFIYYGIIGLVCFFSILYFSFIKKIPKHYNYCKYYLLFVALTTIASHSFFTEMLTMVISIYIIDKLKIKDKKNN